jgi:NAD(P)-dependent dehydrogenase (short-subunit alcohol dehydrogenase family)
MKTELGGLSATGTGQVKLSQLEGLDEMLRTISPLQIAAEPEDYCGPYVLLASRANSSPMTGVVINTDGGLGVRGFTKMAGGEEL